MIAKKKIYPEIWDRDPAQDDSLGYLMRRTLQDCGRRYRTPRAEGRGWYWFLPEVPPNDGFEV